MDREEISDECDNLCFGLESLIQPLRFACSNPGEFVDHVGGTTSNTQGSLAATPKSVLTTLVVQHQTLKARCSNPREWPTFSLILLVVF